MKKMNYEESKKSINERATVVTQMLAELKAGKDINFNKLTSLITLGFTNELALLAEVESYRANEVLEDIINNIDVPSFMKK